MSSSTDRDDCLTRALVRVLHVSPPIRDQRDANGRVVPWHEAALAGYAPPDAHHPVPLPAEPAARAHAAAATAPVVEPRFFDGVSFNVQIHIKELLLLRSARLALLQTTFPPIHWASMALLGCSIICAFLIESDEQAPPPPGAASATALSAAPLNCTDELTPNSRVRVCPARVQALQFLDLLQLRVLFTLLVGALAGIASICIDLNDLFRGSFSITPSTAQLRVLQRVIDEDLSSSCQ